jgi:DNA invertase Pin-like site-specific DNA recombinase
MVCIGYARVSTAVQDTALQLDALRAAGVSRIYQDSASGVAQRPQLDLAIRALKPGSVLVLWKVDRAARSLADLLHILTRIKAAGAAIKSLTEPIDTSTPIGEFTFQILGAVAQLERSMIRERVVAGQLAARARGQKWGAPRGMDSDTETALVSMYLDGGYTIDELADIWGVGYGVARGAVCRVCNPRSEYLNYKKKRSGQSR